VNDPILLHWWQHVPVGVRVRVRLGLMSLRVRVRFRVIFHKGFGLIVLKNVLVLKSRPHLNI
jgi:hypothetical protein